MAGSGKSPSRRLTGIRRIRIALTWLVFVLRSPDIGESLTDVAAMNPQGTMPMP